MWNITIVRTTGNSDSVVVNISDIFIQVNAGFEILDDWVTLEECTRIASRDLYNIKCSLDRQYGVTYLMRVIQKSNISNDDVIIVKKSEQYGNGLLCYPKHGIKNFTFSAIRNNGFDVAWSFYSWDLFDYLIGTTDVIVSQNADIITKKSVDVSGDLRMNRVMRIGDLEECTRYNVSVVIEYNSPTPKVRQTRTKEVTTRCDVVTRPPTMRPVITKAPTTIKSERPSTTDIPVTERPSTTKTTEVKQTATKPSELSSAGLTSTTRLPSSTTQRSSSTTGQPAVKEKFLTLSKIIVMIIISVITVLVITVLGLIIYLRRNALNKRYVEKKRLYKIENINNEYVFDDLLKR